MSQKELKEENDKLREIIKKYELAYQANDKYLTNIIKAEICRGSFGGEQAHLRNWKEYGEKAKQLIEEVHKLAKNNGVELP